MRQTTNELLQRLPRVYRQALIASMEEVSLPVSTILFEPGRVPTHAHFVLSGSISVVDSFQSGDGVEIFSVGREGLVEATHLLGQSASPARAVVQIEGRAIRCRLGELQLQFTEYRPLQSVVLAYVQRRSFILEQLSACNRHHEVDQRIARWLLMMQDRLGAQNFPITQDVLAELLGTRRTTVTRAARRLRHEGVISYSRGDMKVLNRRGLERKACECYAIVRRLAAEGR